MHPESLMMSHSYAPSAASQSVKPPVYHTSTFVFDTAEAGKAHFELAYGLREPNSGEEMGNIYSRLSNPNLQITENRLCLHDAADDCALFASGMAAITTVLLEFCKPGMLLLYSMPVYGGTDHFIAHVLPSMGVHVIGFEPGTTQEKMRRMIDESGHELAMIYVETPANPTNALVDIEECAQLVASYRSDEHEPVLCVDNTYMGPVWCSPMQHGADLVVYSATKYIGGHSDLLAGAVLGKSEHMLRLKTLRTFMGNMCDPHTAWLLARSLETLGVRLQRQNETAQVVARWIREQPEVERVVYLGFLEEGSRDQQIFKKQYKAPGAMIAVYLKGGEKETFSFLNTLKLIKLAVSLGSNESLIQHPASMTHAGLEPEKREAIGITSNLVRLSVGLEHPDDLIRDLAAGLAAMQLQRLAPIVDLDGMGMDFS